MFINWTDSIGIIVGRASEVTTGSLVLTLGMLLIVLLAFAIMFGIALEWTAIIVLPLLLGYASYYGEFWGVLGLIFIYLSLVFTQRFIFK